MTLIDQHTIEILIGAAGEGQWGRFAGAVIVGLVTLTRTLTQDRFSESAGRWISAVTALFGGIGAALLAGTVWWHALLIGVFVAPSSRGIIERIRELLPKRKSSVVAAGLLMVLLTLGCGAPCPSPNHPQGPEPDYQPEYYE